MCFFQVTTRTYRPRPRSRNGGMCLFGYGNLRRVALPAAADQRPLVRAGLGPRLAARERQAEDRPLHHAELRAQRPGVVWQAVALADLAHLRRDLAVPGAGHVGV